MIKRTLLILLVLLWACSPWEYEDPTSPIGNQAPETYLTLTASDTIYASLENVDIIIDPVTGDTTYDTTWTYYIGEDPDTGVIVDTLASAFKDTFSSRQELYWWGEDRDGEVNGYRYRWSTDTTWTYTTNEVGIFYIPITTLFDVFIFEVVAIDNDSLIDPSPARLVLPIRNSPPEISFRYLSNPLYDDLPEPKSIYYTFPTRTFVWDIFDQDGKETIDTVYYAMDDTCETCWTALYAASYSSITLDSIPPGEHKFYLKVKDIAGAYSRTIFFPDESDVNYPDTWIVKEPAGELLLVDDYPLDTPNNALNWYQSLLDTMINVDGYSIWEIGEELPYSSIDLTATLSYFDKIIWYAGYVGSFTYHDADRSINAFIEKGGHFFLNFATFADTALSWFPISSVTPLNPGGDINSKKKLIPQIDDADTLMIASTISVNVKGFESTEYFQSLYHLQLPEDPEDLWQGEPNICGMFKNPLSPNSGNAVILSIPLYKSYTSVLDTKWEIQNEEHNNILYGTDFINDQTGWVVGEDGIILHTIDGGDSWEVQYPTDKDLRSVDFVDEMTGWAVGKSGTILHTVDGGTSWSEQNSETSKTLYSVIFIDENSGWVAGKSGTILQTNDGGNNWSQQESGTGMRLEDITFIDSQKGWCVGAQGTILFTDDGGEHWITIDSGLSNEPWFYSVCFIDSLEGWIVGVSGIILKTTNGGDNWSILYSEIQTTLCDVLFLNNDLGWAVGKEGKIISTIDGGENWVEVFSNTGHDLWSIYLLDSDVGKIVGGSSGQSIILNKKAGGGSNRFFNLLLNNIFQ